MNGLLKEEKSMKQKVNMKIRLWKFIIDYSLLIIAIVVSIHKAVNIYFLMIIIVVTNYLILSQKMKYK